MARSTRLTGIAAALAVGLGCGGSAGLRLSADDNDRDALVAALATQTPSEAGKPRNATGRPLVFLAAREKGGRSLIAFDLENKSELWRVNANITSKVAVGRDFIALVEDETKLVAREVTTGSVKWTRPVGGAELLGVTADETNVYYTVKQSSSQWVLHALSGASGAELWQTSAPGQLGAPAAANGLVFSPFLKQWLVVLDAKTGTQLTRIRGEDEEISFVRATPSHVFFGSNAGVFLLDDRAASGKRSESTYGSASLPKEFIRVHYHWDGFDTVQSGYSAYDRNRILWRGDAAGDKLSFSNNRVVVHNFRFFFGFEPDSGTLAWAYSHPRIDVIGSEHVGKSIGFVSMLGDVGALDPATGTRVYRAKVEGQLLGATFDAEGWAPSEADSDKEATGTAAALAAIAQDRDARFNDVKRFAVATLSTLPGGEVTRDLLALIQDEKTPPYLVETAVEVLVARKDPAGIEYLNKALSVRYDYIDGTQPRAVGVVARALAAMGDKSIDAAARGKAVDGLLAHLRSPETNVGDLPHLIMALGALGAGAEVAPLRSFLLTSRADPAFSTQIAPMVATIDVLLAGGGVSEYELVAFVASDPRTQPAVAEYAVSALAQLDRAKKAPGGVGGEPQAAAN